jgi:hypothetical protein
VNPRIALFWPHAARPAARIKSKRTPPKKRRRGRFENLVARYYRGVCTFASRLTDDAVEAVLLTHAVFLSTRKLPAPWSELAGKTFTSPDAFSFAAMLLANEPLIKPVPPKPATRADVVALAGKKVAA